MNCRLLVSKSRAKYQAKPHFKLLTEETEKVAWANHAVTTNTPVVRTTRAVFHPVWESAELTRVLLRSSVDTGLVVVGAGWCSPAPSGFPKAVPSGCGSSKAATSTADSSNCVLGSTESLVRDCLTAGSLKVAFESFASATRLWHLKTVGSMKHENAPSSIERM